MANQVVHCRRIVNSTGKHAKLIYIYSCLFHLLGPQLYIYYLIPRVLCISGTRISINYLPGKHMNHDALLCHDDDER